MTPSVNQHQERKRLSKIAVAFALAIPSLACDMTEIGDTEEGSGMPMHEVILETSEGDITTLGFYSTETGKLYQSSTLESEFDELALQTDAGEVSLFPHMEGGESHAQLKFDGAYSVVGFERAEDNDSIERAPIAVGVAYVDAQATHQDAGIAKSASWGSATYPCTPDPTYVLCRPTVTDLKQDGHHVTMSHGNAVPIRSNGPATSWIFGRMPPGGAYVTNTRRYFTIAPSFGESL